VLKTADTAPNRRDLRSFGVVMGLFVASLFGVVLPWLRENELPIWPWVLSAVLLGAAAAAPLLLRPLYRAWLAFGSIMSRITTPVVLGLLFFVVVTPIARVRALFGNDALARQLAPRAKSYRVNSRSRTAQDLERPF
jgi:hypothetical protein